MFKILRYFSLTSLVAIVAVTSGLLMYYRDTAVTQMIEIAERRNVALTRAFSNSIWPRFSSFVKTVPKNEAERVRARKQTTLLREAVLALMEGLPILRVKIYQLDGFTVFSTDEEQIGESYSKEPLFALARGGQVGTHLTHHVTIDTLEGEQNDLDILESYLPIRPGGGEVEGVIELYADVTPLIQRINRVQTELLIGLILAFGLLYGALFLIVRQGDRILKKQYADLEQSEENMKAKNRELNREIEERMIVEEALRAAKLEAERANFARSRFFAAASHDLRQPLHAVALYLPVLAKRVTAPREREIIGAIKSSYEAMGGLLDALLDFSKLDAGVVTPEVGCFSISALFDKLTVEFAPQAQAAGIELRVVRVDANVATDPTLLGRMLRNLLSNALRYTRAGRILLGGRRRDGRLRIEVWDTGAGIPEDKIDEIFTEFCQLDSPGRDRGQGLGLGLAIVARLASLLDHPIDVKSMPGVGSMFAIEVPFAEVPAMVAEEPAAVDEIEDALTGALVVLIDDDADIIEGTQLLLEDWGCRVIAARTISLALMKLADDGNTPDAILADFRLQGNETGIVAVERIREFVGAPVPAVIVTGDTDPERLRDASESGLPLFRKPVAPEDLYAALAAETGALEEAMEADEVGLVAGAGAAPGHAD